MKLALCGLAVLACMNVPGPAAAAGADVKEADMGTNQAARLPSLTLRENHKFTFTNKRSGFYLGNSHAGNTSGFEGWTVDEFRYLHGYGLVFDGRPAAAADLKNVTLFPDRLVREYNNGVVETLELLDGRDVLAVTLAPAEKLAGVELEAESSAGNWRLPVSVEGSTSAEVNGRVFALDIKAEGNAAVALFAVAADTAAAGRELASVRGRTAALAAERAARMEKLLALEAVNVNKPRIEAALQWAALSMDSLIVDQWGPGIWAGLPWFNNYWGRDSFISFTGAVVTSGQFSLARDILRSFAKFQLTDEASPDYGRIPNRVTNNETSYNTADGSLWFVLALNSYLNYSGDAAFAAEMYPVIKRIMAGGLKRADGNGFLRHGDAETWMDAVGPSGPWTPRGDRAVDIQALWYAALQAGARLAGKDPEADTWRAAASKLRANFAGAFLDKERGLFFDHLNADGTKDARNRPNQFFVFSAPDLAGAPPLMKDQDLAPALEKAAGALVYPYGVLSLDPADPDFHPYHEYAPYYPKDAAYHNGIIWTWLAGPVIRTFARYGQAAMAEELYSAEAEQILTRDASGGFSELLEAWPRPAAPGAAAQKPRTSGTVTQAWNLAEFNRNFVEDLVGYRPDALNGRVVFLPQPLRKMTDISVRLPYKGGFLNYRVRTASGYELELDPRELGEELTAVVRFPGGEKQTVTLTPGAAVKKITGQNAPGGYDSWKFAKPAPRPDLPVFAGADYQLLSPDAVYYPAPAGRPLPLEPDGPGSHAAPCGGYKYPFDANFKEGILNLEGLKVYDEGDSWGFEVKMAGLWDPAWHPEYGFQLTYLAIALGGETAGKGALAVGMEANFRLPAGREYDRIIYVGGGIEVRDAAGRTLAAFVPQDTAHRLGFVADRAIRLRLPKTVLPRLSGAVSVLSGAQDDHGGAGLGNFRPVKLKAGQWTGGGAASDDGSACRVYDALYLKAGGPAK